jgi:tRNA (cmo5U34)-methyltransferase
MPASSSSTKAQPRRRGTALWQRLSAGYEWLVPRIVPQADAFFDTCISFVPQGPVGVLELGSGTSYATAQLLRHNPKARVTCLDFSREMIEAARAKPALRKVRFIEADIRGDWPEGRFDVIFTTLCLHHLSPVERCGVLQRGRAALRRNGCFINGDIFKPASRWEESLIRQRWLASLREQGLSRADANEMLAKRQRNMRCFDTLETHRSNLRAAGFRWVVCLWFCEMAGVFAGLR